MSSEPFPQAAEQWNLATLYSDLGQVKQQCLGGLTPHSTLTQTEQERLRGLLCGFSPAEIAAVQVVSEGTVKVSLSNTLYRYVEALTGRSPNSLESWRDVATWLKEAGYRVSKVEINWNQVPDVSVFYGRETELETLDQWVAEPCRLIALCGPGGMGKTALAVKLAGRIRSQFDGVIWQSFRHSPPLEPVLRGWIQQLSEGENEVGREPKRLTETVQSVHGLLNQLMEKLVDRRYFFLLDNVETLLRSGDFAGHYRPGYEEYGEFFRRLGEEQHQSCALLTSREPPRELVLLAGPQRAVRCLDLGGLEETAARQLLQENQLSGDALWHQMIRIYRGNPLVLKMVATTIGDVFGGNVAVFLKQRITLITSDLSDLIERQFERLSATEQAVLYRLAEQEDAVSVEALPPEPSSEMIQALGSLLRRSLIERSTAGFTLQPVVREYVSLRRRRQAR